MLSLTKLRKKLVVKIKRADRYFGLFRDGEKVILGISGGIDSLFMADILYYYKKQHNRNVTFIGAYIDNGIKPLRNFDKLKNFLEKRDMEFIIIKDNTTKGIIENRLKPFKPCYVCAKERRKRLIYIAKEKDAKKIALAHSIDDAIETLFLNILYSREISTMVPKQSLFSETFFVIRPIILVEKNEIEAYMKIAGYSETYEGTCPYASENRRETVRSILKELYTKDPIVKKNLKYSLFECKINYLWKQYRQDRRKIIGRG